MVSGAHLERFVCFQGDDLHNFMVLRHFVDSKLAHEDYKDMLDDLEERWYGVKKADEEANDEVNA